MPTCFNNPCVLRTCDVIISCFVITPLTIIWWSGTWQLMDIYLYPQSLWISYWISLALGSLICVIGYFVNPVLASRTSHSPAFIRIITCRIFNYGFSLGVLNFWRGVWKISDAMIAEDTTQKHLLSAMILVVSALLLILLRASANAVSLPFWINTEFGNTFHLAAPRFRSQIEDFWWYTADVLVTQFLIVTLVIQVWRGIWTLTTQTLSPDYNLHFHLICAVVGVTSCLLLHSADYAIYKLARMLYSVHRYVEHAFEVLVTMCAAVAGLILWVACWQIMKEDVLGLHAWRCWIFHCVGFLGLLALQATSSLVSTHCAVDAERGQGHGVWWHIDYVTAWRLRQQQCALQILVEVSDDETQPCLSTVDSPRYHASSTHS